MKDLLAHPAKILTAPNGSLVRAAHIVSVSPLFESVELGTDAFAVHTVGSDEPFVFAAPWSGEGPKNSAKRKAATEKAHQQFIDAWIVSLDGASPFFKN